MVYMGTTGAKLSPVAFILNYMVRRGSQPGPLFRFKDGHALTKDRLVSGMHEAMTVVGTDPSHYSGYRPHTELRQLMGY